MSFTGRISEAVQFLRMLHKTVLSQYSGPVPVKYWNFFYYTFFRVNVFNIYCFDLTRQAPEPLPMEGIQVLQPTLEELAALRAGRDLPHEFYYDQSHGLTTCQIAVKGGEVAYIQWICQAGDASRFFRLGEGVARITNVTTLPAFRGQQLMTKMFSFTLPVLQEKGYRKVVSAIHSENVASIKSILRAGYRQIGSVRTVGRFNRKTVIS